MSASVSLSVSTTATTTASLSVSKGDAKEELLASAPQIKAESSLASSAPLVPKEATLQEGRWWNQIIEKTDSNDLRQIFFRDYKVGSYAEHLVGGRKERVQSLIDPLTIAFFGPPAAGKSSTVNTLMRVIEDEAEYMPVAGVNDDEPGRMVRTRATQNFALGRARDPTKGQLELWDVRGNWHVGEPKRDLELIRSLLLGVSGVGEDCAHNSSNIPQLFGPEIEPVGGYVRRPINLIAFVIRATCDDNEQSHLTAVLNMMNQQHFPYVVLVTKCDEKYGDGWSTSVKKLVGVPENDTLYIQNYTASKHRRNEFIDRKAMMVLFKMILAAEKSLIFKQKHSPVLYRTLSTLTSVRTWVALVTVATLLCLCTLLSLASLRN